jgi:hypothetical protein
MNAAKGRGGYRRIEFGCLVRENPEGAAFGLREAWAMDGSAGKAARRLGISQRSFFRFVAKLRASGFAIVAPSETAKPGIDTVRS